MPRCRRRSNENALRVPRPCGPPGSRILAIRRLELVLLLDLNLRSLICHPPPLPAPCHESHDVRCRCIRNSSGRVLALAALRLAVDRALEDSNCLLSDVRAVCLGLAGISSAAEGNDIADEIRQRFPTGIPIAVYNDAVTALAAGTSGKLLGCSIIVGTGEGLSRRRTC